jgi:hypothetical protein
MPHANLSRADLHEAKRIKPSVRVASTANVSLTAPGATLDGITLSSGDRILLKDQTTASQNGIYVWTGSSSTLTRATDSSASSDFLAGDQVYVRQGTTYGATYWYLSTSAAITLNTTSLAYTRISAGSSSGTVTSVALTVPTGFSVSGSPVTSSGTLAVTESTQSANTVKAGPTTGSAATPAYRALVAADIPTKPYVNIQDQKSSGTAGGTFTSGAWRTRDLNTKVTDTGSIASLASNQITLPAGTYRCHIIATGSQVNNHQARLQDTTGAATLLRGTTARSPANGIWATSCSEVSGLFTLSVSSVLEVQHQCSTTEAADGFGVAGGFGTEVYTTVQIWKEG